jgi:hypothetical protein
MRDSPSPPVPVELVHIRAVGSSELLRCGWGGPPSGAWSKHRLVSVAPFGLGFYHRTVRGKTAGEDGGMNVQEITFIHFQGWGAFDGSRIPTGRAKAPRSGDIAKATEEATRGQNYEASWGKTNGNEGGGRIKVQRCHL